MSQKRYKVVEPVEFEYTYRGNVIRGTVPDNILVDGTTLPVDVPFRPWLDRAWFQWWIVHDWLLRRRSASVNGVVRPLGDFEIHSVFPWVLAILISAGRLLAKAL
jgi:hypothetical protein